MPTIGFAMATAEEVRQVSCPLPYGWTAVPWRFRGRSLEEGVDCWGICVLVWRQMGIEMGEARDWEEEDWRARFVEATKPYRAGDLILWTYTAAHAACVQKNPIFCGEAVSGHSAIFIHPDICLTSVMTCGNRGLTVAWPHARMLSRMAGLPSGKCGPPRYLRPRALLQP
jgi:cell wall-associated NlpC family hydrolase